MTRLLFIGIDALDAVQVDKFGDLLPNIRRLRETGHYVRFESVWPPDSETAWASIYTGWNPARHGVFRFVDPLEKTATYVLEEPENGMLKGNTFWDLAGSAGCRVNVLFPHVGYPAWPVNGLMITRASVGEGVSITPPEASRIYNLEGLSGVKGLIGRHGEAYLKAIRQLVERQLELNLTLLADNDWDLFFSYWSALDLIQHQFWAYCDPGDPTYPGDSPFRYAIHDFYVLHDQIVGRLLEQVDKNTTVIVMSDHGHGMRPIRLFNINRLLREHGYLFLKAGTSDTSSGLIRRAKAGVMDTVTRFGIGNYVANAMKLAPWVKKLYIGNNLDLDRTIACTTDMSGIKAYAYGGIRIARQNLNGRSYEKTCEEIMALLWQVHDPEQGTGPIIRWIKPREELYSGPHIGEYPDLVFELNPAYGAGWDATGSLFDVSHTHNLYSGSHLGGNALFMMAGPNAERVSRAPTMMDIAPTVLDVLGVAVPQGLDGTSFLKTPALCAENVDSHYREVITHDDE